MHDEFSLYGAEPADHVGVPHVDGLEAFADGAGAGAGRVDEDAVERPAGESFSFALRDDAVRDAAALHVDAEACEAQSLDVVGDEDSVVLHELRDLAGLAAGRGAQVEDVLAGLRFEDDGREHGCGFLDVVVAKDVFDGVADVKAAFFVRDPESVRAPWDGHEDESVGQAFQEVVDADFEGVDADAFA